MVRPIIFKGRRGWMRIFEAFIAVLIIASVFTVLTFKKIPKTDTGESIYQVESGILDSVEKDTGARNAVLNNNEAVISAFIEDKVPPYFNYTVRVCSVSGDVCAMPYYVTKDVYTDDRIISSTLDKYEPKKIKIFVWEK